MPHEKTVQRDKGCLFLESLTPKPPAPKWLLADPRSLPQEWRSLPRLRTPGSALITGPEALQTKDYLESQ